MRAILAKLDHCSIPFGAIAFGYLRRRSTSARVSIVGHYGKSMLAERAVFAQNRPMKSPENDMLGPEDQPFPSSVDLVLRRFGALLDTRSANALALEAAVAVMAPATKTAITADLKCFLGLVNGFGPVTRAF